MATKVRNAYDRVRVPHVFSGDSRTKQSFAKECDINNIMKRYEKDGVITHFNRYGGQYGDFTNVPEYRDAIDKVRSAEEMFMSLPASIRTRFENDPGSFLSFVADPANRPELEKMGLMRARPEPEAPAPVPENIAPAKPAA